MRPFYFRPALLDCLSGYTAKTFGADIASGVTVGVIALPMAMAFAIASGLPPATGLVTAVIAGFISSALGGTRLSVSGPTGAFVSIVGGIAATYGFSGLLICTMMAGVMLVIMGLARLGGLIRYIPMPLISGFTTGIAVIIFCGQIKDFTGIHMEGGGQGSIPGLLLSIAPRIHEANVPVLLLGLASLLGLFFWPRRLARFVPPSIAIMIGGTLAAIVVSWLAPSLDIPTIGSRFGGIPRDFSLPSLPVFDLEVFQRLLAPAATIALLGAIESLLCASAADGMTNGEHNPDQELIAQGVANFVTPFFGGIPSTGAIARTAANIRSGGKTPVSGMVHAIFLLAVVMVAAPLASYIPLTVLSAILVKVAINMGDWREFVRLYRYPKGDAMVFVLTFALTVVFGLTQAVSVGMLMACVLFIRRMSMQSHIGVMHVHPRQRDDAPEGWTKEVREEDGWRSEEPSRDADEADDDIMVVTMDGAMFFGAAQKIRNILPRLARPPKVMILRMNRVIAMDATAALTLENLVTRSLKLGIPVLMVGVERGVRHTLLRSGLLNHISRHAMTSNTEKAMRQARRFVEGELPFDTFLPPGGTGSKKGGRRA